MSNNSTCVYCNGRGYVIVTCSSCNGEGGRFGTLHDGTGRQGFFPCRDEDCRGHGHYHKPCICTPSIYR